MSYPKSSMLIYHTPSVCHHTDPANEQDLLVDLMQVGRRLDLQSVNTLYT